MRRTQKVKTTRKTFEGIVLGPLASSTRLWCRHLPALRRQTASQLSWFLPESNLQENNIMLKLRWSEIELNCNVCVTRTHLFHSIILQLQPRIAKCLRGRQQVEVGSSAQMFHCITRLREKKSYVNSNYTCTLHVVITEFKYKPATPNCCAPGYVCFPRLFKSLKKKEFRYIQVHQHI